MTKENLFAAIEKRDPDGVRQALDAGADPDARDSLDLPALWRAVGQGERDIVALLLEAGARVDARTAQGNTPLMLAAARGDAKLARLLLDAGADPKARNRWDFGPENWANWPANAGEMLGLLAEPPTARQEN